MVFSTRKYTVLILFTMLFMHANVFSAQVLNPLDKLRVNVYLISNPLSRSFDELTLLKDLCDKYLDYKYMFTEEEELYYRGKNNAEKINKRIALFKAAYNGENDSSLISLLNEEEIIDSSEDDNSFFSFPEKLKINIKTGQLNNFKMPALFGKSSILAKKVLKGSSCDYLLIPASLDLENDTIRVRLMLYSLPANEFYTLYDKIVPSSEAEDYLRVNFIKIFKYLGSEDYGILRISEKDFPFTVFLNLDGIKDTEIKSPCILKGGKYKLKIISDGYEEFNAEIEIKALEALDFDFELKKIRHGSIVFDSDGMFYKAFSSSSGSFTLPQFFDGYDTPSSISFSYPGFDNRYISLSGDTRQVNVSLKPRYFSGKQYMQREMRHFYNSALFSIAFLALDAFSRSFVSVNPDSSFYSALQKGFSYAGYFSISLMLYNIFDYYFSTLYSFE